jgi:CheY-like chemotaxis protein
MLESEPFSLLIVDLHMPKMDGLQVLSIARRKYPQLRLVVLTGVREEQFRTRAYALGVDQFWIKPETDQEMGLFMESIESLLAREALGGFRGVQSKSLVDLIQMECMSQSSSVLKITNGILEGKIWIQNGEVIHAEVPGATAEPAFQRLLSWKTGSFEILPADTARERTIFTSYQGLLLNTVQALDEAASQVPMLASHAINSQNPNTTAFLADASQLPNVEFILMLSGNEKQSQDFCGLDNPRPIAEWIRETLHNFRELGEHLQVGEVQQVLGTGPQRKVALSPCPTADICVGFPPNLPAEETRDTMKTILTKWAS